MTSRLFCSLFVVACVLRPGASAAWTVRVDHPRFMWPAHPDSQVALVQRIPTMARWDDFVAQTRYLSRPGQTMDSRYLYATALAAVVTQDSALVAQFVDQFTRASYGEATPNQILGRLSGWVAAYDLGYHLLTEDQRNAAQLAAYSHAVSPSVGISSYWGEDVGSWKSAPFFFYGDYETPDSNAFMLAKIEAFISVYEAKLACVRELYGEHGYVRGYYGVAFEYLAFVNEAISGMLDGYDGAWASHGTEFLCRCSSYYLTTTRAVGNSPPNYLHLGRLNSSLVGRYRQGPQFLHWCSDSRWVDGLDASAAGLSSSALPELTTYYLRHKPWMQTSPEVTGPSTLYTDWTGDGGFWWWSSSLRSDDAERVQIWGWSGPKYSYETPRDVGSVNVSRGSEFLSGVGRRTMSASSDELANALHSGASAGNTLAILEPTETWVEPMILNDGGQRLQYWSQAVAPSCYGVSEGSYDIGVGATSDTLPQDAVLDFGVVCDLDSVYSDAKANDVLRSVKVFGGGRFVLVHDFVEVVGSRWSWQNWQSLTTERPATATVSWETVIGAADLSGGVYQTSQNLGYVDVVKGAHECVVYPVAGFTDYRLIGGPNRYGQSCKQNYTPVQLGTGSGAGNPSPTYVESHDDISYEQYVEHWTGPDTFTYDNYVSSRATASNVAGRNSPGVADPLGDWRVEFRRWTEGSEAIQMVALLEVGASTALAPRSLTASVDGLGYAIRCGGTDPVSVWEPALADSGYGAPIDSVTVGADAGAIVYAFGLSPGTYDAELGGVVRGAVATTANGNLRYAVADSGSWTFRRQGSSDRGACCIGSDCTVTTQTACDGLSGYYFGDGSECLPNPCLAVGACCKIGMPLCVYLTAYECDTTGTQEGTEWVWWGQGSVCSPNPCLSATVYACCTPDGSCFVATIAECTSAGGSIYSQESCSPSPCPQPMAACCRPDGSCIVRRRDQCLALGYEWLGYPTTCEDPGICSAPTDPTGACCASTGTCTVTVESECGGSWTNGGDCDPNECTQPSGACCAQDGSCTVATDADCNSEWLGYGTSCSPNPCVQPPVLGACCWPSGACSVTTDDACDYEWLTGTACAPNPCSGTNWWRWANPFDPFDPFSW